jgi:hypothetical protein
LAEAAERLAGDFLALLVAVARFDSAFFAAANVVAGPVTNMHPMSTDAHHRDRNSLPNANTSTSNSLADPV